MGLANVIESQRAELEVSIPVRFALEGDVGLKLKLINTLNLIVREKKSAATLVVSG